MGNDFLILLKVVQATLWLSVVFVFIKYFMTAKGNNSPLAAVFLLVAGLCFTPVILLLISNESSNLLVLLTGLLGLLIAYKVLSPNGRRQLRELLSPTSSEEPFGGLVGGLAAHAFEGVYLVDPVSLTYIDVNTSGAVALKYKREAMLGMPLKLVHPNNLETVVKNVNKTIESGRRVTFVEEAIRSDGKPIEVEIALKVVVSNNKTCVLAVGRDLTRRKLSQHKIDQLNQLYKMLTLSNRAITRIQDRAKLSKNICDLAIDKGGFVLAWIGDVEGSKVIPACYSGKNDGYVENLNIDLSVERYREGPVVKSINERKVICINNLKLEQGFQSLKEEALKRGFASAVSVPIFVDQKVTSILAVYSNQKDVFNPKLMQLLSNLSEDLSYAFSNLQIETKRKEAEKRLQLLSSVVDQSTDAVAIMNADGFIEYVNPRFSALTGYALEDIKDSSPSILCSNQQEAAKFHKVFLDLSNGRKWKGEFHNRKKSGELYWSMDTISPIKDESGAIVQYVSTSEDYTALKQAQDKIKQLAFYDSLTGLPNRRLLLDRMAQAINQATRNYSYVAVFMLDIDKFKTINDSLGHKSGDELIKHVSQRLTEHVGSQNTVARLGADEFIVVMSDVQDINEVVYFAENLLEQIRVPIEIDGGIVSVTTSMGVSLCPIDGDESDDLLRCADLAMYHAKAEGRNNFQFYTREMNEKALAQLNIERRLKVAIQKNCFELYYQPQIEMSTGLVKGVEALIRWNDEGTFISPETFIPIAEESGLMEQIGEWVIIQAVKDAVTLNELIPNSLRVAINLSASQFRESDKLIQLITDQLKCTGLKPDNIELELTESMLIGDLDAVIETLEAFRALGITLAIDDFGTGYSSMSYLKNLPIDTLKIDRSFINDIGVDASDAAITVAIITLANELNMSVLAEGVETQEQMEFLEQHGCRAYQGYFYSKPLPLDKLLELLN